MSWPDMTAHLRALWDWYAKHDECIQCHGTVDKGVKLCATCAPVVELHLGPLTDRDMEVMKWAAFRARHWP